MSYPMAAVQAAVCSRAARRGAAPDLWYLAGGIPLANCKAAYKPLGASSLAASYVNLAHPGTNDAFPGTAPALEATGWKWDAASTYLRTGIIVPNTNWSAIVRFSGGIDAVSALLGSYKDGAFQIYNRHATNVVLVANGTISNNVTFATAAAGVIAIAGKGGYFNGVQAGTMLAGNPTNPTELYIGAMNTSTGATHFSGTSIQYVAIYNDITLTDDQVKALTYAVGKVAGRLVVFGDSTTAGDGASDAAHRWANLLAAAKSWTLQNSGTSATVLQNTVQNTVTTIGAAAANNGRDTYITRVYQYFPDYVAILYGLNDLRLNDAAFSAANFENDLGEIVDNLILWGVPASHIVIGSPPYIPEASYALGAPWNAGSTAKHAAYTAACSAVATAKGTKYVDVYQWMIDNGGDALISGDNIHPNDAGHDAIADAFLSVL